ncbi:MULTISPECIES: hypothetical protein [Salipiger]|uniref:Lipoprotein n=1 Tax=Salipiger profundus TaxID=1229727 RepID=A0A1U7CZI8_9RHOB|nr:MULTISPECIES: hypothetical protein [Salipiger]ALF02069.1 hypothetical protein vBThpSP1_030 [Thiobacimonas phage vB_ThpS-P1]APX21292.1 hypothetical protein Ga0080559_TMP496 [Salipiger profundus]GGA03489.1 hypothetical protein GCM10011326_13590 [Salipiger profundus]
MLGQRAALAAMLFICALIAFCLVATAALAQPCFPRDDVLARLTKGYGEAPRAMGLTKGGALMEMFASDDSGTWSIVVTLPSGLTCLLDAGSHFQPIAAPPEGYPT